MTRNLRAHERGFTLIELLIAVGVLAMLSMLMYGAFDGLERTRDGVIRMSDRYHEGRAALQRIVNELSSAYISAHQPPDQNLVAVRTAFIGTHDSPAARVDFNCFCYRRYDKDSKESDQAEISYFGSPNPDGSGQIDLARRVSAHPDTEPEHGGKVEVLATNLEAFELSYLDAANAQWTDKWDSTQALTQKNRLPLQVKVSLLLKGVERQSIDQRVQPLRFVTKVELAMREPLTFGVE
jgi:general secretion pathway protein J